MKPKITFPVITALFLFPTLAMERASATPVTVPNFSFETPDVIDGGQATTVPNWTFEQLVGSFSFGETVDPTSNEYTSSTGDNATLPGTANGGQFARIELFGSSLQVARFLLTPALTIADNTSYTLTVAIGNGLISNYPLTMQISLYAGNTLVAGTGVGSGTVTDGTFQDFSTITFTTGAGDPNSGKSLTIELYASNGGTGGTYAADFDNVRLDATVVPEPSTFALCALTAALWFVKARSTKRVQPSGVQV